LNLTLKSESAKGIIFFGTVLVLAFAFCGSLLATVGTIGEEWRTVGILEANPNSYTQWIWTVVMFGILPISTGLIFCIVDFLMQRRNRVKSLSLLLLVAGVLFGVWGIYYSLSAYSSYATAISLANQLDIKDITGSLQIIYVGYESIGILCLVLGLLLCVTFGYIKHAQRLDLRKQ
jgi:hypothetical protein